jgi:two-component system sensor histidine kinase YesM
MVSLALMGSLFLLGIVSFQIINKTERQHGRAAMISSLRSLSISMQRDYYGLINVTQLMMPTGIVGHAVDNYFAAKTLFDRWNLKQEVAYNMAVATFSGLQTELVLYYDNFNHKTVLSNSSVIRSFSIRDGLGILMQNGDLALHGIHRSQSRISNYDVVSIDRKVLFGNGNEYSIYIETRTSATNQIAALLENENLPYVFLQLDEWGVVKYSSSRDQWPINYEFKQVKESLSTFGQFEEFMWAREDFDFGFSNLLMLPKSEYFRGVNNWLWFFYVMMFFAVSLIFITNMLLYNFIDRPLKVFSAAIDRVADVEINVPTQLTGVIDF